MSVLICIAGIVIWALGSGETQLVGFLMAAGGGIAALFKMGS